MIDPSIATLATKSASIFNNSASIIFKKVEIAKTDKDKIITKLEESIHELIKERTELDQLLKGYDELLDIHKSQTMKITKSIELYKLFQTGEGQRI